MGRSAPLEKAARSAFTWLSRDLAAKAAFSGPPANSNRPTGLGIKGKSNRGSSFSTKFNARLDHRRDRGRSGSSGCKFRTSPAGGRSVRGRDSQQHALAEIAAEPAGLRPGDALG